MISYPVGHARAARLAIVNVFALGAALAAGHSAIASERIALQAAGIGQDGDSFGAPVAISGDTLAVGIDNGRPDGAARTGAIGVYRLGTDGVWRSESFLGPVDPATIIDFGGSLGIEPDMIVGSGYVDDGLGLDVETFVRNGAAWSRSDAFTIEAPSAGFGVIGLSDDSLIVSMDAGAMVYTRSGNSWVLQATLPGDQENERIERAQIDGDVAAVVGSTGSSISRACHVHFFSRSGTTWTLEDTIDFDVFSMGCSSSVAVSGQTVLIGSLTESLDGTFAVDAYVRDQGVWSLQGPLDAGTGYNGASVAIEGDRAIVGSPEDDLPGIQSAGTAYVFERSGGVWTRTQHFADPAGGYVFEFGSSVALTGSTVVVGSPGAVTPAGRAGNASIFTLGDSTMTLDATLDDGESYANEAFGYSLAGTASTLAIGAPYAPCEQPYVRCGAAYVFAPSVGGWALEAELLPTSALAGLFGNALALDGETLVVGSPQDDDARGSAYVFTRGDGTWPLATRLSLGNDDEDEFGESVALGGGWLFAGEPGQDFGIGTPGAPAGQVRVYAGSGSNWADQGVLTPSASTLSDEFGYALALSGDTLLVGAPRADDGIEVQAGLVFVFVNSGSTWTEQARLEAPMPAAQAGFGVAVALTGDTALIGAGANYEESSPRGAAYVFHRAAGAWTFDATLAPATDTTGGYGHAVAISADAMTAIVGMPHSSGDGPGRTFVFRNTGGAWVEGPTLQGASTSGFDEFGTSLVFNGGTALAGAPFDGIGGAAYAFGVGDGIFSAGFDATP